MAGRKRSKIWLRLAAFGFPAMMGFAAIALLAFNVSRDITRLNSASSDNIQWTLSQTEVEFLQFDLALSQAQLEEAPDVRSLRRRFDVFFSRIRTLRQASIYSDLREVPEFADNLATVGAYLEAVVPDIDSGTSALQEALPALKAQSEAIRPDVRSLSVSGLNYFAEESDSRRNALSGTLMQLAAAIAVLVAALAILACYLAFLNVQNVRRRTQALEASERMNIVTSTALDAVVVADTSGRIVDFNAAAEQIFGHSAKDAVGCDLGELIVPDHHRAAHEAGMARLRKTGEKRVVGSGRFKLEAKRANGEVFPVELAIQSADTKDGEVFIAFLRDISHQVQAEAELVLARDRAMAGEKAKTDFLATMSHEIRTPLNGLLGNLTLLEETRLSTRQSRYIRNMQTSGKLLMSHISDVLDITKFDAGKLRLHTVDMNISTLLKDIVDSLSGAAAGNGSTLEWGWTGAPLNWVHADRDRIQHILMNIVGNAVKFTKDGRISITAQASAAEEGKTILRISVRDTGIGIDPGLLPHIFDDFATGDSSYDREVGGTGLGLGIAQRFVKALGGRITVESTPGEGSVFTISFPVQAIAAPEPKGEAQFTAPARKRANVLLVEDNEINRHVAREMLTAQGHFVTEAHNGREAVEMAEETGFDLILMDISMPVMDGRSAARAIRKGGGASARAPIIAVTANAMAEEQEAFLKDGMNDVLTKPLTREGLLQLIADHPSPAPPAPEGAALRSQQLIELEETVGAEALKPLLNRFAAEMEAFLKSLENGQDLAANETAVEAHWIAGSAATFGLPELRSALIRLEKAALSQERQAAEDALSPLRNAWTSTKPVLNLF
ncbi:response regulator [Leisingera aquaemixtae]|uniref:ATP-binding protein n=1 Tax=Leisingera aquaemixtae TaxID=1396826 RepID=UPI001C97E64A|nr:ATP-binding protein [Leisingera aquaemixtae]MBY6068412.1 response regulator [Leisingera aquaemixtae]